MAPTLATRLGWGERRVDLPAGRYDTVLPPTAVADLMIYAYWAAGARDAHDGQTVFCDARRRHPDRRATSATRASRLLSDPAYAGLRVRAVRRRRGSSGSTSASSTTACR